MIEVQNLLESNDYLKLSQPLFPIICFFLAERKLDQLFVTFLSGGERYYMGLHVAEVVSAIFILACSQTLSFAAS
jgi:hypothetical protein